MSDKTKLMSTAAVYQLSMCAKNPKQYFRGHLGCSVHEVKFGVSEHIKRGKLKQKAGQYISHMI